MPLLNPENNAMDDHGNGKYDCGFQNSGGYYIYSLSGPLWTIMVTKMVSP